MRRGREGIGYGDGAPSEAWVQVFGEQEAASGFCSGGEDDAVPKAEAMADCELGGTDKDGLGGFSNGIAVAPRKDRRACLRGSQLTFADKNLEEFGDGLRGQDHRIGGQSAD